MRRLIKLILAAVLFFANLAVFSVNKTVAALSLAVEQVNSSILSSDVYVYDQSGANTADGRLNAVAPTYLIYPDAKVDLSGAADLLDDLGIVSHLDEYTTKAYVINPVNDDYDDAVDEAAYLDVLEFLGINANVKVIGIGDGATFVNDVVSQNSWCVAGIMSYGGDSAVANVPNSVPAYLHGASASVANAYIDANSAAAVSDGVYINPDNELEKVVVSNMSDAEESLDVAFNNAWDSVFGNNYRMYNEYEEWYTAGLLKYQTPYELVSYVNYDKLGITVKNQTGLITPDATVAKPNQWYEYIPSNLAAAGEGTVPLVVTLHGNTNDNRMQGETSGWVEKAAEQGFMVIACEHQASGNTIFDKYTALQEQGTIDVVKKVLNDYPQLDPSRVYLCGLSMGAMRSYLWGINNSEIFAAVEGTAGVQSSQIVDNAQAQVDAGTSTQTPVYMVSGTHDVYGMIPVTDSASFSGYNVIKAYGLYNDLDIPATPDLSKNEWYGLELDNQGWDTYNDTDVYAGTLSNEKGVMLKAVAMDPYAHWNNKQIIDDVWEFFSQYSKNPQTGVLTVGEPKTIAQDLAGDGVAVYGSYTIEQEATNVYHIHDSATSNPSSMYLLLGEDDALLIDGSNGTKPAQFDYILNSLIGDRELAMAITHNHGDHLGLLANQTIAKDVKIYVPRDDYNATTQQLLANNGYGNISLLDDQDVITCGDFNLTAQYLKGHTNGGMVFIEPDKELVFSGDEVGSGFAWILFVDDALTKYEQGLRELISTTASMDNLVILPGHKWQTTMTTESGTKGPGTLGATYLQDMLKVLDGIANGTAKLTDYTHVATYFPDSVEATVAGAKAAIDTRSSLIDQYVAGKNLVGKTIVNQKNSAATSVVVDTGDEAPIVIYYGLAAIGIIGLLVLNRRKFGR